MRTTSQLLRDEGIKQVEGGTDLDWLDEAYAAVEYLTHTRDQFTADDVWPLLTSMPKNNKALGAVMQNAHRDGIIKPTSHFVQTQRASSHARPLRVWAAVK